MTNVSPAASAAMFERTPMVTSTASQMTVDKFYVAYYLLLAIFLIRLADPITRAVYGPADKGA